MAKHMLFARLTKVDEAARTVTGVAASEAVDAADEVFDYDTSKPQFQKWSDEIAKATNGQNLGNIRAMHGKVAAGKVTELVCDDVAKTITITAHIVDDNEWTKVLKAVYTGFSIGGAYLKKWIDATNKAVTRYTAKPVEISLVDLPCNPDAYFSVVKADGGEERIALPTIDAEALLGKFHAAESLEVIADLVETHLRGTFTKVATAEDDLQLRAERLLVKLDEAAPLANAVRAALGEAPIEKGLWAVQDFVSVLSQLASLATAAKAEAAREGDNSPLPAKLAAAVAELGKLLLEMAAEEVDETIADVASPIGLALAAAMTDLAKAGDDLQKLQAAHNELLAKHATLTAEHEVLKDKPAPVKGVLTAVNKGADGALATSDNEAELAKAVAAMPDGPEKTKELIKLAYKHPV